MDTVKSIFDSSNVQGQINESEYKIIISQFLRNYYHQPNALKWTMSRGHGTVIPLEYNNQSVFEIPILNDIEALDVRMEDPDKKIGIAVQKAIGKIVEMGGNFELSYNTKNSDFNGQDRTSIMTLQIAEKMAQQEDVVWLKGNPATGLEGVLDKATPVTNTGAWGVESSGILTNVKNDIKAVNTAIANQGLPLSTVDCILTNELYNILSHSIKVYGDMTALDYLKPMLNGGDFYPTNNLLATVSQDKITFTPTTTENIALFIYKTPRSFIYGKAPAPVWKVDNFGFKYQYHFKQRFGFAYPITGKFIYKITGISTASS